MYKIFAVISQMQAIFGFQTVDWNIYHIFRWWYLPTIQYINNYSKTCRKVSQLKNISSENSRLRNYRGRLCRRVIKNKKRSVWQMQRQYVKLQMHIRRLMDARHFFLHYMHLELRKIHSLWYAFGMAPRKWRVPICIRIAFVIALGKRCIH